jgi:aspartyl-tRNA(Asn)/glutamyl-tRNA(Gln) amidotransferase subunit A
MQVILWAEAAATFEEFIDAGLGLELVAPEDRVGMLHGLTVPAVDYLRALRIRTKVAPEVEALMERYDALIAPAYAVVAPPVAGSFHEHFEKHPGEGLSAVGNLYGLPSICLPTGLGTAGLPTAIELLGSAWREPTLIAAGAAYQARTDWHRAPPPSASGGGRAA